MRNIADGYIAGDAALDPFFPARPFSLFDETPPAPSWAAAISEAPLLWRYEDGQWRNVSPDPNASVIITGQQPGLLTGPLYTIYKAVTTILLAERLETVHGRPFLPVFWVAADDHDFEEVRRTTLLTKQGEPMTLTYEPKTDVTRMPMRRVPIEDSLHALVDQAADNAPNSDRGEAVRADLHAALETADSFAGWFTNLMGQLFAGTPLCFFAPGHETDRKIAAKVIERDIRDPGHANSLIHDAGERLSEAGYATQLQKRPEECNFFLEMERERCKVIHHTGAFTLPEKGVRYGQGELLDLLDNEPGRFSPNVALRCVAQQLLFPVVAYVAGPGEVAYWAQLPPVFEWCGQSMPVVYPRASAVMGPLKVWELLQRYDITPDDLDQPQEPLIDHALAYVNRTTPLIETIASKRANMIEELRALEAALRHKHPPAGDMAAALQRSAARYLDRIEAEILRADQQQVDTVGRHISRVKACFYPWRRPQERMYTVYSFLFSHGYPLMERLLNELDVRNETANRVVL